MVEAHRAQEVLLFGAINTSHLKTVSFGKLHPECADTTTCAIDQQGLPCRDVGDITETLLGVGGELLIRPATR